jgi:hypothetical protein
MFTLSVIDSTLTLSQPIDSVLCGTKAPGAKVT